MVLKKLRCSFRVVRTKFCGTTWTNTIKGKKSGIKRWKKKLTAKASLQLDACLVNKMKTIHKVAKFYFSFYLWVWYFYHIIYNIYSKSVGANLGKCVTCTGFNLIFGILRQKPYTLLMSIHIARFILTYCSQPLFRMGTKFKRTKEPPHAYAKIMYCYCFGLTGRSAKSLSHFIYCTIVTNNKFEVQWIKSYFNLNCGWQLSVELWATQKEQDHLIKTILCLHFNLEINSFLHGFSLVCS